MKAVNVLARWIQEHVKSFEDGDDASVLILWSNKTIRETESDESEAFYGQDAGKQSMFEWTWRGNPKREAFFFENAKRILSVKELDRVEYPWKGKTFII